MYVIYTDGACSGNPGPGGWAALILPGEGGRKSYSGREDRTTNQRMEVTAAIKGIEQTPEGSSVLIRSDSQYLIKTMTDGWKRQANTDLWEKLDRVVASRRVNWEWVKGHDGDPLQEEADRLARQASSGKTQAATAEPPPKPADPAPKKELTHLDEKGKARMVDITQKPDTDRVAVAKGAVLMAPATLQLIKTGQVAKGDVLTVARIAGITGAKQTPHLIPMSHPIMLTDVSVDLEIDEANSEVQITATAKTTGKTGVEMEALTAVAIAALTIYDMCKSADRAMRIEDIRLVSKSGGKSGTIVLEGSADDTAR